MIDTSTKLLIARRSNPERCEWIDLPFSDDEFKDLLHNIGIVSGDESDDSKEYENFMCGAYQDNTYYIKESVTECEYVKIREDSDPYELSELVDEIESLDENEYEMLEAIIEADGESVKAALDSLSNSDFYPHTDLSELAEQFADDGVFGEDYLLKHVDYEAIGRELSDDGYTEVNGGVLYRR